MGGAGLVMRMPRGLEEGSRARRGCVGMRAAEMRGARARGWRRERERCIVVGWGWDGRRWYVVAGLLAGWLAGSGGMDSVAE